MKTAEALCRPLPYHLATAPGYAGLELTTPDTVTEPLDCASTVPLNRFATAAARSASSTTYDDHTLGIGKLD